MPSALKSNVFFLLEFQYNKAHHEGQKAADGTAIVEQANPTDANNTSEPSKPTPAVNAPATAGTVPVPSTASGHYHNHHASGGYHPSSASGNYYYKKERMASIQLMTSKTNIYIKGLDENTTDKDLYEMCQK